MPRVVLPLALVLACVGCGGSSSPTSPDSSPTPTPSPTPAPTACTLSPVDFQAALLPSAPAGFAYDVRVGTLFSEVLGQTWHLNRAVLKLMDANGNVLEQPEIGRDAIIAALGSNEIAPYTTQPIILEFPFNATGISAASVVYDFTNPDNEPCNWTIDNLQLRVVFP